MCGIVGMLDLNGRRDVSRELLSRINEAQHHRGPDECGLHVEPGVGLGHRRLSIIDVSTGQQPLYNEDGSVVIVYNGEIYNYQELIPELTALGHRFRTKSDTEVIVHAWEAWGERCVERFRGMFAFALWDRNRKTLFLARDRLGVKPLHYALLADGTFLFGSEIKALLAHPAFVRDIDPHAVEEYFALGYVAEPRTIFKAAHKLPPAHTLCVRQGAPLPAPVQYWDPRFTLDRVITLPDAVAELRARLDESVRLRLISEVPLGAFLSGGVDSSAVVASMANASSDPVNTCSIAFADPAYDESRYAQQVADRYRTRHFVDRVESDDFDLIDTLARVYDEPYADSSAIPTYRVCQLARKHVTVALSGDGGDENFGGYRRYRLHMMEERMRRLMPLSLRRPVFGMLAGAYPKADWAPRMFRAKSTFEALGRDPVEAYCHGVSILRDGMRRRLFTDGFRRELGGYSALEVFRRHAQERANRGPAGAGPIPRPEDLSGRRHQHQGRPREHGALARSARAPDGPPAGRMAGHAAVVVQGSGPGRQMAAEKSARAATAGGDPVPAENGLCGPAGALVPRPAAHAGARCAAGRAPRRHRNVRPQLFAGAARSSPIRAP